MNKFCTLQTETLCSNRSLTHLTEIISSVSAIFPKHEPSQGNIVHIDLVSDSPQPTCPQAALS